MLTYKVERYSDIAAEMVPLWVRHWKEVARDQETIKLDVDHSRYLQLCEAGALVIVTARAAGVLVGYIAAILSTHLHYTSTLHAGLDVFWLDPQYRNALNGVRLFTTIESELKLRGVKKVIGQTKLSGALDVSEMFKYLGWTPIETLFAKALV